MPDRTHRHRDEAGYVTERAHPLFPGERVTVYRAEEAGIDVGGDPYAVVCDPHGTLVAGTSLAQARASLRDPASFCDACRAIPALLAAGPELLQVTERLLDALTCEPLRPEIQLRVTQTRRALRQAQGEAAVRRLDREEAPGE